MLQIPMLHKTVSLAEQGLEDLAWTGPDVIEVIVQLDGTKIAVVGGDVFAKEGDLYRDTYDSWCCNIKTEEQWDEYAERSREKALEYVEAYPQAQYSSYIFSLVLTDKPSVEQLLKIHSKPASEPPYTASKPKKSWWKLFQAFMHVR